MRKILLAAVLLLSLSVLEGQTAKTTHAVATPPVEAQVRKLWQAFKSKDKATLATLLDDSFRMFEEGLTTFGDKKAEINGRRVRSAQLHAQ